VQAGRPRGDSRQATAWLRSYRSLRFPTVAVAVALVVVVASAVAVPPVQDEVRTWWGSATLTMIMLVGYGAAIGALGADRTVHGRSRIGRRAPAVIALAPLAFLLLVSAPLQEGAAAAGSAVWGAIVLSLLLLRAASRPSAPWPVRAAALGAPSWLLAVIAGMYLVASRSPELVAGWLFPVQLGVVIAGVVAIPGVLVVESVSALEGEGWIGRWLAPETEGRAWVALAVKGLATIVLILILAAQGIPLAGWLQAVVVAVLVLLLLWLGGLVGFGDLTRGRGLAGRLRLSITLAMAAIGVLFGGYVLLLAARRPLALLGLAVVAWAATSMPAPPWGRYGRIVSVAVAGALAAWGWAAGPAIGLAPSATNVLTNAVPVVLTVFGAAVLAQVVLALRAREWGYPVLVLAVVTGAAAALATGQRAGVVPVNLLVLPVLAAALLVGRLCRKRLFTVGTVIRWSVLSLIGVDLLAAASMATGLVQEFVLGLTFLTLGLAPLILSGSGGPRIRAAGLVCSIFTALVAALSVGVRLEESPTHLLEMLDQLAQAFFWVIAFPVSAALSTAAGRLDLERSPSPKA